MTGGLWAAFGGVFLAEEIVELPHREFFLGWSYYISLWGYLLLCLVGGGLLFAPPPLGRWLVTGLAVALGLYALALFAAAEGPPLWAQLWCGTMLSFGVWSIFLVQRRNA